MIINNKRIWLGLFIGIVMSFSVYGQNINAEKITVPDSKLTNLYQIDSGVYRSSSHRMLTLRLWRNTVSVKC